ncbi:glycosyltransferase [Anaerolineales bacterium HSG24]|nr:glycosyltransferase [Anaerolineales bacterium HSG24]
MDQYVQIGIAIFGDIIIYPKFRFLNAMKTIVIISYSNLYTDPRVNRQIRFLSQKYRVIAIGFANPQVQNVTFMPVTHVSKNYVQKLGAIALLSTKQYETYYWKFSHVQETLQLLNAIKADLIIANDLETLPVVLRGANGVKVVFDAHEYFPKQFEDRFLEKLFFTAYKNYFCKLYIPKVDGMMTVCQKIADEYEKDMGVKAVVVTNAPKYHSIEPNLKSTEDRKVRMIHHGGANPSRRIENMIKVMDYIDDRFELDLLLVPFESRYTEKLKKLARHNKKIRFLPPVPMQELVAFSSQYDIGLFLLQPTSFSYLYALPNKFFEFIQARIMVAIGPSPEMAHIVQKYDLGVVSDDFQPKSLAKKLSSLTYDQINYYKQQSDEVAHLMSAEQNKSKLFFLIEKVLRGEETLTKHRKIPSQELVVQSSPKKS